MVIARALVLITVGGEQIILCQVPYGGHGHVQGKGGRLWLPPNGEAIFVSYSPPLHPLPHPLDGHFDALHQRVQSQSLPTLAAR